MISIDIWTFLDISQVRIPQIIPVMVHLLKPGTKAHTLRPNQLGSSGASDRYSVDIHGMRTE